MSWASFWLGYTLGIVTMFLIVRALRGLYRMVFGQPTVVD